MLSPLLNVDSSSLPTNQAPPRRATSSPLSVNFHPARWMKIVISSTSAYPLAGTTINCLGTDVLLRSFQMLQYERTQNYSCQATDRPLSSKRIIFQKRIAAPIMCGRDAVQQRAHVIPRRESDGQIRKHQLLVTGPTMSLRTSPLPAPPTMYSRRQTQEECNKHIVVKNLPIPFIKIY